MRLFSSKMAIWGDHCRPGSRVVFRRTDELAPCLGLLRRKRRILACARFQAQWWTPIQSPVSGATVFLRSLKNKSIRSFTTEPGGKFRFTQVNMAEDNELWAEKDGKKSAVKTVSQWDARKEFETELKLK